MRFAVRRKADLEQRRTERTRLSLVGQIYLPAEETTIDCRVIDLSVGGAGVECSEMPPLQAFVILYIDGFGRFEAVVTRVVDRVLGMRFVCNDAKRKRLVEKLTRLVENGAMDPTSFRRHKRVPGPPLASFLCENGDRLPCEVTDISLTGASLKTHARPLIGETIRIGRMPARVVRYRDNGFAVVFRVLPAGGIEV